MRAQSSIEFLATYSFLFLIIGVVISALIFMSIGVTTSIPQVCTSFAGPNCNFVSIYSNKAGSYSLVTFSITNSQSVPINITSMNTTIKNTNYPGSCAPAFLYPGQEATCISNVTGTYGAGINVQGSYYITAMFCNSGVSALQKASCNYQKVTYGGSFTTTPVFRRQIVFSISASQVPGSIASNLIPYTSLNGFAVNNLPVQPNNYTLTQNGDFVTNVTGGVTSYAFAANSPAMLGQTYLGLGYPTVAYPRSVSSLNGNFACSTAKPFNTMLSIASTTVFVPTAGNLVYVSAETGGAMEIFYRKASNTMVWNGIFGGSAWKPQGPAQYTGTIYLYNGLNDIEVVWSSPCGGGQVVKIAGLP